MARTTTKKSKAPSIHSRAARRETSPSINTDKSLKTVQPPPASELSQRPAILGLYQNAGVSKKTKKQGRKAVLSTRARRRHERGLERAEEILDRTATKVVKSRRAAARVQGRSKGWEEINASVRKGGKGNLFAGLAEDDGEEEEEEEEDDDDNVMEEDVAPANNGAAASTVAAASAAAAVVPAPAPPPQMDDDEDEIL